MVCGAGWLVQNSQKDRSLGATDTALVTGEALSVFIPNVNSQGGEVYSDLFTCPYDMR